MSECKWLMWMSTMSTVRNFWNFRFVKLALNRKYSLTAFFSFFLITSLPDNFLILCVEINQEGFILFSLSSPGLVQSNSSLKKQMLSQKSIRGKEITLKCQWELTNCHERGKYAGNQVAFDFSLHLIGKGNDKIIQTNHRTQWRKTNAIPD